MMNAYILLAALAPILILLFHIYRKDKDQPEPVKEMVKAFFYGVVSAFLSFCISIPFEKMGVFVSNYTTVREAVQTAFFAAAIPEEVAKYIMLWLFLRKCKYFDQRMDGIVYAVCVSLGFAALENIFYLIGNYDNWLSVGISRALTAVPGHYGFGVLMGYCYSLGKFDNENLPSAKYKALIVPILVHGLYDVICFVSGIVPSAAAILMIVFIVFCHKLWKYGSKRIREHLERDLENAI